MTTVRPYDFAEAQRAHSVASANQKSAEERLRDAWKDWAAKESAYRQALAEKMLLLKADGVAWTVCGDLARGDKTVADLRYARDVAEGVREAAAQAAYRYSADRRRVEQLVDWSKRVAPDGQSEPAHGFEDVSARRAA